jgi:hypothetical protein
MDTLLDKVIRSCLLNVHVYSKVKFDNAKDTQELLDAADYSGDLLIEACKHRLRPYAEEMLVDKIESNASDGKVVMRVGSKYYQVQEMKPGTLST